jgi:hypothetical protein
VPNPIVGCGSMGIVGVTENKGVKVRCNDPWGVTDPTSWRHEGDDGAEFGRVYETAVVPQKYPP